LKTHFEEPVEAMEILSFPEGEDDPPLLLN